MSLLQPAAFYETQLTTSRGLLAAATKRIRTMAQLRLLVALIGLGFLVAAINNNIAWQWWTVAGFTALFLVLVRIHSRLQEGQKLLQIRTHILAEEQRALAGDHTPFEDGAQYTDALHPYTYDLDMFGKGSIYQLLNRTVTIDGGKELAAHLKDALADAKTIADSQAIIRELSALPEFISNFRVAGLSVPEAPADHASVLSWLCAKDDFISKPFARIAVILMPAITIALLAYSIYTGALHAALPLAVLVNWIILLALGKNVKLANARVGRTAGLVEKFQRLQEQTAAQEFQQPWLREAASQSRQALQQIIQFRKLANMFDSRNNGMTGPLLNSLFLFDIYCLLRLESWRKQHRQLLEATMDAMIALDVFISCANYAFNHPEQVYPVIVANSTVITADDLRHPLLQKTAVGNSCQLGSREQCYLLTGANMTGKSTFIRTIGANVILAYLGLPVPARSFSLPLLRLYTSMRVTDSVQDDVSYFRAELNRIKSVMDAVALPGVPCMVLLDEPLRGTNSADKQQGTRAIIERLLKRKAIGIIATHDIGLCDLEHQHPGEVSNYHFESVVTPEGLRFDFKLHAGCSTSNNATVLMRQMGIID